MVVTLGGQWGGSPMAVPWVVVSGSLRHDPTPSVWRCNDSPSRPPGTARSARAPLWTQTMGGIRANETRGLGAVLGTIHGLLSTL